MKQRKFRPGPGVAPRARKAALAGLLPRLALASSGSAWADDWPTRPLRLILPAAPGGSSDPTARLLADEMSKRLGQPIAVLNRPGAGGNVGLDEAARAGAEVYTIVPSWPGQLDSTRALFKDLDLHTTKDF